MKKALLSMSAALFAVSSLTAGVTQLAVNKDVTPPPTSQGEAVPTEVNSLFRAASITAPNAMIGLERGLTTDAQSEASPIYEAPTGETVLYSRNAIGYYLVGNYILFGEQDTSASNIVYGEDGYAYICNPFSSYPTNTYLKCEIKDNKLVAELPQLIYQISSYGYSFSYYADILYKQVDDEGNINYFPSNADVVRTVSWTIDENGNSITMDMDYDATPNADGKLAYPDVMLGMVSDQGVWTIAGDCAQSYEKFEGKPVTAPEGAEFEDWVIIVEGEGRVIRVAFDGNDVYLSGISEYLPDGVAKGSLEGDKIVFESRQYMGDALGYFIYFMGGAYEGSDISLADSITFNYDAEKKIMKADTGTAMMLNASLDRIYYMALFMDPELKARNLNPSPQPSNPIILGYNNYLQYYGWNEFQFILPNLNEENDLLDTSKMYYQIFIDDDIWTFEPGEDYWISSDMYDIPYNFSDGNGISSSGVQHLLKLYFEGFDTIGVKLFNVVDENTCESDKVTLNVYTGEVTVDGSGSVVSQLDADKTVANVEFFSLQGVKVTNPSNGVFVCKKTFEDGTSKVAKVVVR